MNFDIERLARFFASVWLIVARGNTMNTRDAQTVTQRLWDGSKQQ